MDVVWERFRAVLVRDNSDLTDFEIDERAEDLLVARDVESGATAGGWNSAILSATCRLPMTFYPSTPEHRSVFSDKLHRHEAAIVKPSQAFWSWLTREKGDGCGSSMTKDTWQLRGTLKFNARELAELLGPGMSTAIVAGEVEYCDASVWAGAGGTRTPLHVDMVHALVFQVAGTKQFLLASESAVEKAAERALSESFTDKDTVSDAVGALPYEVLSEGNTHNFLREGSLAGLYGVDEEADSLWVFEGDDGHCEVASYQQPRHCQKKIDLECNFSDARPATNRKKRVRRKKPNRSRRLVSGQVATLFPGDVMLLPAGVYHDVQSTAQPAISITIRFSMRPFVCPVSVPCALERVVCCRPFGHFGVHVAAGIIAAGMSGGFSSHNDEAASLGPIFNRWRTHTLTREDNPPDKVAQRIDAALTSTARVERSPGSLQDYHTLIDIYQKEIKRLQVRISEVQNGP